MLRGLINAVGELTEPPDGVRPSQQIALRLVAKFGFKKCMLGGRLYALGKHRKLESAAKTEH
jgi:hypothetical protein